MSTKEKILDSAEFLVRHRGYDGFSYADIEKEVGIRKASIHHHFTNKQLLVLALVQRYRDAFADVLAEITQGRDSAGARLGAYLDVYRNALSGGETLCLCAALSAGSDSLSDDVLQELNAFHDESIAWLEALFAQAKRDKSIAAVADSAVEAYACLAMVEGAQLIARAAHDAARFDAASAKLRARIR